MTKRWDLGRCNWTVEGYSPDAWKCLHTLELGLQMLPEVGPVPARVPGSVQQALLEAGLLPDWNAGLNHRACEWVENRAWIFRARLPEEISNLRGRKFQLVAEGLDYRGVVLVGQRKVGSFANGFIQHRFDLGELDESETELQVVFEVPPRWLGQISNTSRITDWKVRFNYTWDWTCRMVQIGIWDGLWLEAVDEGPRLEDLVVVTDFAPAGGKGIARLRGRAVGAQSIRVRLLDEIGGTVLHERSIDPAEIARGVVVDDLPAEPWFPAGHGRQALYRLAIEACDGQGNICDRDERLVGFKHVEWRACAGAPAEADPWLCVVNGKPIFLAGVNWTSIRVNYADVSREQYEQRLRAYRDCGFNLMRVWGGGPPEREDFHERCDRLGLLVWQDMPLSSSGLDNTPPETSEAIAAQCAIARDYVRRQGHHASLLMWNGGNELTTPPGSEKGIVPCDLTHPLLSAVSAVFAELDPVHRFLPTTPSGPKFGAAPEDYGKGIHWDVHGPWRPDEPGLEAWERYWAGDDALFRSEVGCPGASPVDVIREYAGGLDPWPVSNDNPLWARSPWWCEDKAFAEAHERPPHDLEEYVEWSQRRQADALAIVARRCLSRFPAMGGVIIWMGHDTFPCAANTAILDFHGRPKPAALALRAILRESHTA